MLPVMQRVGLTWLQKSQVRRVPALTKSNKATAPALLARAVR
jgi:hypothetical protein